MEEDTDSAYKSAIFVITDEYGRLIKNISTTSTGANWYYDVGLAGNDYTIKALVDWNDNVNDLTVDTESISVHIPDSDRVKATWTDHDVTSTTIAYVYGRLTLTTDGDEQLVKDQIVTVTLATLDGSWSTTTYIDLSAKTWSRNTVYIPIKFYNNLTAGTEYILTVNGTLREIISLPNGQEEIRDNSGILYQGKVTAQVKK